MRNPRNYVLLATLAILWGSSFLLIKVSLEALSPLQIVLTRVGLGAGVLLILCAFRGFRLPAGRRLWLHVAVAAVFASAVPWTLYGIGEQTVDSGMTGVLNATTPLWTAVFGLLLGRERAMSPRKALGLLLGFGGTLLIFAPWESSGGFSLGMIACVAAAASYGIGYVYIGRNLSNRGLPPITLAAMQMIVATGIITAAMPVGGMQPIHLSAGPVLAAAVLGILGTGLAFAINYRLIAEEGATTASTVTYVMPIISVALGWLILGEQISIRMIIGMLVVLVGVALNANVRQPRTTPNDDRLPTAKVRSGSTTESCEAR